MIGLLNLHKPAGVTSRDVVNQVQRLVRPHKVGHAGTLDPLATGVLVVCIGQATRLIEYVQRMKKRYVGTFLLGRQSPTEDVDGEVEELPSPTIPTRDEIAAILPKFLGEIQQTPPAFSALKVKGKRAYDLARQGVAVELAPRPVMIHEVTLLDYAYPQLTLDILCGSGTYVRSLGRDIARALGTEAVMSALERRAIGLFHLEQAVAPESLTPQNIVNYLRSIQHAVAELPALLLNLEDLEHVRHGRAIADRFGVTATEAAGFTPHEELACILQPAENGRLRTVLCFLKHG